MAETLSDNPAVKNRRCGRPPQPHAPAGWRSVAVAFVAALVLLVGVHWVEQLFTSGKKHRDDPR